MERDNGPENILGDAIARNQAAVLSLPSAGMLRHCKSRLLSDCEQGVWLESAVDQRVLIDELIGSQRPAAVSFKAGTKKVSFAATLLRRDEHFRVNADTVVEAVLMARPAEVKAVQRRNDYRVRISTDADEIQARMWRIPEHVLLRDRPLSALELHITMRDLSLGGMGVLIAPRANGEPLRLLSNERVRIELKHADQELLIEGRLRHIPPALAGNTNSLMRVGVQFSTLENDMEGRQTLATLTKIVGALQRDEVRRMRLGIA
jgi:c-di-GMP-binding flagellar brake protein YcgR